MILLANKVITHWIKTLITGHNINYTFNNIVIYWNSCTHTNTLKKPYTGGGGGKPYITEEGGMPMGESEFPQNSIIT